MSQLKERIAASFNAQGLMTTLGARLVSVAAGEVVIELFPTPGLTQQHGYMHAGAITSVVDSACGYAALSLADADHEVLTIEFKVNFMRPAKAERFIATGKVVKAGRTISVCQGEVIAQTAGTASSIALMQATMMLMPTNNA